MPRTSINPHCPRCRIRLTWAAPSPLWNLVMRENDINAETQYADLVCIRCFIVMAEEAGIRGQWRVYVNPEPEGLLFETPSGRVWDADRWLWVEPAALSDPVGALAKVKAEVWDEGWNAACDYMSVGYDGPDDPPNPYGADRIEGNQP